MEPRPGTAFSLEVTPRIPPALGRLEELANNLWFSWDRPTRMLFARLDPELWEASGHSPKAVLKGVDQRRLDEAAHDPAFLHDFDRTLEVTVEFGERDVHAQVWKARIGCVGLYLLDTDLESNRPEDRATAHRLYGGDRNTRIQQEIVLGIGGARALEAMGIKPTVW